MPLPAAGPREEVHVRHIELRGYRRADGLFEIDGRINDRKSQAFVTHPPERLVREGEYLHDMQVRVVVDEHLLVHEAMAVSDATPYGICPQAAAVVAELKGARIAPGWRGEVLKRVGGVRGCAHIAELLVTVGAAAYQTLTEERRKHPEPRNTKGVPLQIDSCYAFARHREVVAQVWPEQAAAGRHE